MSIVTVDDKGVLEQHPTAVKVYEFDFDSENLAPMVTVTSAPTVVTVVRGLNTTPAIIDQTSILVGNRKTRFRFSGGTEGTLYRVTVTPITSETPTQTKPKYVDILVQT